VEQEEERRPAPPPEAVLKLGGKLYEQHCADCHGKDGRGAVTENGGEDGLPAYPPLAGNRTLQLAEPVNAIRIVLNGGFAPATAGNPRPYGMPPYSPVLSDAEVAAVVSYVRAAGAMWRMVTAAEVNGLTIGRCRWIYYHNNIYLGTALRLGTEWEMVYLSSSPDCLPLTEIN
jgi:mono/diheme cytochrome c family protein